MDSVSPFITIGDFCVYKRWGYLISFKCAQIDQIIFSVSGSNQSVTFTQIIIFQVHNNYQKEVNGFKLSLETYYLSCREPYNLVQSPQKYFLFWPVMLMAFVWCLFSLNFDVDISNLSPTSFVSDIRHQIGATNVDAADFDMISPQNT